MTTENKTTSTLNETAENLKLAKNAKDIFSTAISDLNGRRRNFTIASAVGAVAGVGLTALSDRSNVKTLAATAVFGGLITSAIYNNPEMALHEDGATELAITGSVVCAETALFGCVMNLIIGDSPEEKAE